MRKTLQAYMQFTVGFFLLIILSFTSIDKAIAYEREIILEDKYQAKGEKESLQDKFKFDFSLGYGFSYAQVVTGIYEVTPAFRTYLRRLDLDYAETISSYRFTTTFLATPTLGIYIAVPFGLVEIEELKEGQLIPDWEYEVGVGDVYGGIFYTILQETQDRPSLTISVDANSDIAEHYSLGNGVWDYTTGFQSRKFVADSIFLSVLGDYTFKESKNGVEPGDTIGYGGGIGFVTRSFMFEVGLKAYEIEETKLDGATFFQKDEDLVLTARLKHMGSGSSFNLSVSNINEDFDWERNVFGFDITIPFN